jgi:hypothetical protein
MVITTITVKKYMVITVFYGFYCGNYCLAKKQSGGTRHGGIGA